MRYSFFIILFVILITVTGCKSSEEVIQHDNDDVFPIVEDVRSIKVLKDDGSNMIIHSVQDEKIELLLQGLLHDTTPSYIEDPEPFGQLYKVEMIGASTSQTYTVNDLRLTDTLEAGVKIYADSSDGRSLAWNLPTSWIQLLLNERDKDEIEPEPMLYVTINELSKSVIILSNRDIVRESVTNAIEDTLAISGQRADKAPQYSVYWSDPQRVVVRFESLSEEESVHFRIDGVQAESGESFANKLQPIRNQVILYGKSSFQGLRWMNKHGDTIREHRLDSAALLQPVWSNPLQQNSVMVYDLDNSQIMVDLDTGDTKHVHIKRWPQSEGGYGNDYGTDVLFSDRFIDGTTYVVKGNRIIYHYREPDILTELYVSQHPIYGFAASPDNTRIAILVPSDPFIGPYADLIVLDEEGNEIFREEQASYIAHSDGFLFVYPMTWENEHTIVVPMIGKGDEAFHSGKAYVHIADGTIEKEADLTLPVDALNLLKEIVGDLDESDYMRVLPAPHSVAEDGRYYAVQLPFTGNWLIDMDNSKVTWLGTGILVQWNQLDEVVIWRSEKDSHPIYIGVDFIGDSEYAKSM